MDWTFKLYLWEPSKDQPFAPTVNYIGFTWDIENWVVTLSASKVAKYVQAIDDWNNWVAHTLMEAQGLYISCNGSVFFSYLICD